MIKAATGRTVTPLTVVTGCLGLLQLFLADLAFIQLSQLSKTETVTRRGEKVTACGYKANFPIFFILVITFVMANCHYFEMSLKYNTKPSP